jgi:hypothetical protein
VGVVVLVGETLEGAFRVFVRTELFVLFIVEFVFLRVELKSVFLTEFEFRLVLS